MLILTVLSITQRVGEFSPVQKQFTTRSAFFLHAAWLDQSCLHCPIFLTAASRRSLVRVSVPVWGFNLSVPLLIVVLVSRYLTNKLISRIFILIRLSFNHEVMLLHGVMEY